MCQACRGCRDCKFRRERCTDDLREVLQQVEAEMVLEDGKLTASYPWKPAVQKMRNNRQQVLKNTGKDRSKEHKKQDPG